MLRARVEPSDPAALVAELVALEPGLSAETHHLYPGLSRRGRDVDYHVDRSCVAVDFAAAPVVLRYPDALVNGLDVGCPTCRYPSGSLRRLVDLTSTLSLLSRVRSLAAAPGDLVLRGELVRVASALHLDEDSLGDVGGPLWVSVRAAVSEAFAAVRSPLPVPVHLERRFQAVAAVGLPLPAVGAESFVSMQSTLPGMLHAAVAVDREHLAPASVPWRDAAPLGPVLVWVGSGWLDAPYREASRTVCDAFYGTVARDLAGRDAAVVVAPGYAGTAAARASRFVRVVGQAEPSDPPRLGETVRVLVSDDPSCLDDPPRLRRVLSAARVLES